MGGTKRRELETMEEDEDEIFEVEKLMGHRRSPANKNQVEYLIKWKDYGHEFDSWEKEQNIFSKGLVLEYWSKQPYTLASFKNGNEERKSSPRPSSVTPKKRPTPSAVLLEMEKKRKLDSIKSSQLTAEPPVGLSWEDIKTVENVFHCGSSTYFAEVRWSKPDTVSYIPTRILRLANPLKLIYFYESNTDFLPQA